MADYPADQIFLPAALAESIAETDGTPFFLYDKQGIERSIQALHSAFSWASAFQNYFPLREQVNPRILRLLQSGSSGVNVCSKTELSFALSCGFSGSQILYEPTRKDEEAEHLALQTNAVWMCNSAELIPAQFPERILLRCNPIDYTFTPSQKQSIARSKNGMNKVQLTETVCRIMDQGITSVGLAIHVASYSIKPGFWLKKVEFLVELAQELQEKTGIRISAFYIGEGPGLPYKPRMPAPDIAEEAQKIEALYHSLPKEMGKPILYTGVTARLMEPHGILVTKVLEERPIYRTFLTVDAGMCQYIRPVLRSAYRHVSVLGKSRIENRKLYSIVGDLPDSVDRLVHKGRMLPKVIPGDYLVIHDVGCRARSLPLLYGFRPVAAEYLYDGEACCKIAKGYKEEEVMEFLTAL